jgi:hypothetical protein
MPGKRKQSGEASREENLHKVRLHNNTKHELDLLAADYQLMEVDAASTAVDHYVDMYRALRATPQEEGVAVKIEHYEHAFRELLSGIPDYDYE